MPCCYPCWWTINHAMRHPGFLQRPIPSDSCSPHLVVIIDLVQDEPLRADAVVGAQPKGRPPAPRILRRHRPKTKVRVLELRLPVAV